MFACLKIFRTISKSPLCNRMMKYFLHFCPFPALLLKSIVSPRYHHNIHKSTEEKIIQALEARGVETKKCQRMNYTYELIEWADIIFTTGGDGTFLLGASKVRTPDKPVVGINTDPTRSEGYLCLPKHFSFSPDHAIEELMAGHFRYL